MRTPRGLQELGTSALGVHGAPWRKRPGLGLRPGHNPCPSQHPGQTLPVGSTPAARRSLWRPNRHGHPDIFRKRMKWFDAMHAMAGSSGVFAHEGGERAYPLPWLLQEGEKKMPQRADFACNRAVKPK